MTKHKKKHPTQKTTAQRKAKGPRKTISRAPHALRPPDLPPPRPGPASRREMEKVNRALMRILDAKSVEFEAAGLDPDAEIKKFMQGMAGKSFDEIMELAGEASTEERAQDIADQAMDQDNPEEARRLAAQALAIDPFCMDALYIEAVEDGETSEAQADRIRGALKKWEDHKGPEYFETNRGHFWGLIETRPYMRALASLAGLLNVLQAKEDAIAVAERCLELNDSDNMGTRHLLLGLYLQTRNLAGARRLFTKFASDGSAVFAWGKVLYHYLNLDPTKASEALFAAMSTNPYFIPMLFESERVEEHLDSYSPGEESEAAYCVLNLGTAWIAHKSALEWVIGKLEILGKSKRTKRRH